MRAPASDVHKTSKLIPVSARSPFEYLEYARVRVEDGRIVYDASSPVAGGKVHTATIPYMNTAAVLLGPGTSVTNDAMELFAAGGVVVGFTGGSGTPMSQCSEPVFTIGVSEYRPTDRMQRWVAMWMDEGKRLEAARMLLKARCECIEKCWAGIEPIAEVGVQSTTFFRDRYRSARDAASYGGCAFRGKTTFEMLGEEGAHVKALYKYMSAFSGKEFHIDRDLDTGVNKLLRVGNYIAYGLAASALSTLGISFAFPLLHGKTRRGALVFDLADVIKDGITTPLAFRAGYADIGDYRRLCKECLVSSGAMGILFKVVENISESGA